ncbi:GntR family transcriptional regulator [Nesterenkonia ebinurensis]|uniref:GntR family transcriptional regulator n=1 Tax=Nesterenkonia ebinurensis TaxID=2608252 RepID=UPI00123D46BD|nr:GntR family transcriptional regulator [Nesterenkonia ebinurensis]
MARTPSMSARIAETLEERILVGDLLPAARIRQESIAEEFGVSRLPIREALRILESRGLVRLVASTGAWVSSLDLAECREIYFLRERLEPFLLGEAVEAHSEESLNELEWLAVRMREVVTVSEFVNLDRQFHLTSFQPAAMPRLLTMAEQQWNTTQHYRRAFVQLIGLENLEETHQEHLLITSALRRRDRRSAEDLFALHIRKTRMSLERHPEIFHT